MAGTAAARRTGSPGHRGRGPVLDRHLAATAAHARREVTLGAYVAQAEALPVLEAGRPELARLLGEHGILTTAGAVTRAPREMTEPLLRISPHVDCTPGDLARLRQALHALR